MAGTVRRVAIQNPNSHLQLNTVQVTIVTAAGGVEVTDLILQAGTVGTGWVPNVTEMPWIATVTNGSGS